MPKATSPTIFQVWKNFPETAVYDFFSLRLSHISLLNQKLKDFVVWGFFLIENKGIKKNLLRGIFGSMALRQTLLTVLLKRLGEKRTILKPCHVMLTSRLWNISLALRADHSLQHPEPNWFKDRVVGDWKECLYLIPPELCWAASQELD